MSCVWSSYWQSNCANVTCENYHNNGTSNILYCDLRGVPRRIITLTMQETQFLWTARILRTVLTSYVNFKAPYTRPEKKQPDSTVKSGSNEHDMIVWNRRQRCFGVPVLRLYSSVWSFLPFDVAAHRDFYVSSYKS